MPNVSELERCRQEALLILKKGYYPKSEKERLLKEIRKLERRLGVTPRDYNSEDFSGS